MKKNIIIFCHACQRNLEYDINEFESERLGYDPIHKDDVINGYKCKNNNKYFNSCYYNFIYYHIKPKYLSNLIEKENKTIDSTNTI